VHGFPFLSYLTPLAVILIAAYRLIGRSSDGDAAAAGWAARNGFVPADPPPPAATPTLQLPGGEASDGWQVPIGDGTGTLFRWTWSIQHESTFTERELGIGGPVRLGDVTVVQALLAAGFPHFRVVPRHAPVPHAAGWDEQEVDLESVEFSTRFRLLAGRGGDREALLRLFDPETIVWFVQLGGAAPTVEYGMGTLAVSSRHRCTADAEYEALLETAQRIARRVLAEGLLHVPDPR
jgi:hypothetical protein